MKVRVVGAGFSGLVTAYFLVKEGFDVEVFEAGAKAGGLIQSLRTPRGLIETAANGVLNSARFENICDDIGVALLPARKQSRRRYIWRDGRARRWPLTWLESLGLVWRFARAGWSRQGRRPQTGETIAEWGTRVLGRPAVDRLLGPALQGIYAADHRRLSASLILGRFFAGTFGATKIKPRLRGTVAPQQGMGEFITKLHAWLEARGVVFRWNTAVSPEEFAAWPAPRVVATSAPAAARVAARASSGLAALLSEIEMIPVTTATLFFPKAAGKLPGFGCLFPRGENFEVLGVLMNSFIFEHRGEGHSETWIFRGVEQGDPALLERIAAERSRFYGEDVWPLEWKITRWPQALPHYTVELERILPNLQTLAAAHNVHLIGNYTGRLSLSRLCEGAAELARQLKASSA